VVLHASAEDQVTLYPSQMGLKGIRLPNVSELNFAHNFARHFLRFWDSVELRTYCIKRDDTVIDNLSLSTMASTLGILNNACQGQTDLEMVCTADIRI